MTLTFKCRLLDLSFVTALLLAAAVPLVFLRGNPWPFQIQGAAGLAAILTGIVAVWVVCARRRQSRMPALENGESGAPSKGDRLGWQRTILVAALLGGLTLVNFYSPLQLHFWEGADEFLNFQNRSPSRWMHEWDVGMNRPFTVLPCVIGQTLTPGRVDGFLWLSVALCWVNGLLLFAIVRELLPKAHILPVAAAVLLVIDRSDPTRFFVMWIGNYYWMALAFLLAGSWLFLRSYRLGSRSLLALSCASLGGALLINEASYPLAVLVPVLAWFKREYRHRLAVWTYAWAGMLIVFATRFLLFMNQRGADAYQASQLTGVIQSPRLLLTSLRLHLQAGLTNFQLCEAAMWGHKTVVAALPSRTSSARSFSLLQAWRCSSPPPCVCSAVSSVAVLGASSWQARSACWQPMQQVRRSRSRSGPALPPPSASRAPSTSSARSTGSHRTCRGTPSSCLSPTIPKHPPCVATMPALTFPMRSSEPIWSWPVFATAC